MDLSGIKSVADLSVDGKKVFVRVDFNVPLKDGAVSDDNRIRAALPTLKALLERGASLVLASHLGRPKGAPDPAKSLRPVAARLGELLGREVLFAEDCVGETAAQAKASLPAGGVLLLENLRFHPEEKKGGEDFARDLASGCDVYVNDAFGTCHRAHASMVTMVPHFEQKAAGMLVYKELEFLGQLLQSPARPFVAVLGGAKVSDKIDVIQSLMGRCDALLIGGAMAYTLLKAQGVEVGNSLVEDDKVDLARELLAAASQSGQADILLPEDHVVAEGIDAASGQTTDGPNIPAGMAGFDVGPNTAKRFAEVIGGARTVFWNGPLGVFEKAPFAEGTMSVARALAASNAVSVVGGGDSASAVRDAGVFDQISHVSTGGGASLEFVEGKELPGVVALRG